MSKKQNFVINGTEIYKIPIKLDSVRIDYSPSYLYLGAWFTDSGKMQDVVAFHE